MYPDSLRNLIESFKYLPGIGEKTAERLAFSMLELPIEKTDFFVESVENVKSKIHKCKICNNLTEDEVCSVCSNSFRDRSTLCVIEDVKSLYLFEKTGVFNGEYHILNGLISPIDGVDPEDIELDKLLDRLSSNNYKEIILAFKPSIEGETTALYIKKILEDQDIVITRIASGIPIGADIEYVDAMTLERALVDRKNIE